MAAAQLAPEPHGEELPPAAARSRWYRGRARGRYMQGRHQTLTSTADLHTRSRLEIVGLRRRTGAILDVMIAADIPDDINKIVEFRNLMSPQRLTDVVDVGANPIDGEPPYTPMLAAGLCRVTG